MKKAELLKSIKEEIISVLAEADQEDINNQDKLNTSLETTKGLADELGDALSESINPEVVKALDRFIKAMAKRYDYSEKDAVYAIIAAIKQREFDGLNEVEDMDDDEMDKAATKGAKKEPIGKLATKMAENNKEMKSVLAKYKKAEGEEKEKQLARLKELTKIKKELEKML
jgi:hypothetical protein